MKKIMPGLMVMAIAFSAGAAATGSEAWQKPTMDINGQGSLVIPTGDNDGDWGGAIELKGAYWITPKFGAGLSLGFGSWSAKDDDVRPPYDLPVLEDEDGYIYIGTMPIGASLYFRPIVKERFALNLEAGVRYMVIWNDVNVELDGETVTGDDDITIYIDHDGDADNAWVGVVGINAEYKVGERVYIGFGAGYQFDITDQTYTLWDDERDLSFDGVIVSATLGARY